MIYEETQLMERLGILTSAEDLIMFIEGPSGLGRSLGEVERALVTSIYADSIESGADVNSIVDLLVSNFPESANLGDQGLPVPAMPGQMYATDGGSVGYSSGFMGAASRNIPIKLAAPFIGEAPPPPWIKEKAPAKSRTERELRRSFDKATELQETADLIDAYDLFLQKLEDFSKLFSFMEENRAIPDVNVQIMYWPEARKFTILDPASDERFVDNGGFGDAQEYLTHAFSQSDQASSEMLRSVVNSDDSTAAFSGGGSRMDPHYMKTRMQGALDTLNSTAPDRLAERLSSLNDLVQNYDDYADLAGAFSDLEPNANTAADLGSIDAIRSQAAALGIAEEMQPYLDFMAAWGITLQFVNDPSAIDTGGIQLDYSPDIEVFSISDIDTAANLGSNLSVNDTYTFLTTERQISDSEAQLLIQEAIEFGTASSSSVQTGELQALGNAISEAIGGDIDLNINMLIDAIYYNDPNTLQTVEARSENLYQALADNGSNDESVLSMFGANLIQGISSGVNQLQSSASSYLQNAMQKSQDMLTEMREEEKEPKEEQTSRAKIWPTNVPAWATSWNKIQRNMTAPTTIRATTFWSDANGETQPPNYRADLFELDPTAYQVLDRGAKSPEIVRAFSANDIRLSKETKVEVESPGRLWRLTDGRKSYIIERDGDGMTVSEPGNVAMPDLGRLSGTKEQKDKAFWDEWLKTTTNYFSWLLSPGTNSKGEPTPHQYGIGDLSSERGSGRYIADWLRQNAGYTDDDITKLSPPIPKKRKRKLKKKEEDEEQFSDPFRPWSAY